MTPDAARIDLAREKLRAYLNSRRANHKHIEYLTGLIICARIVAGEITPKLKPHRIAVREPGKTRH